MNSTCNTFIAIIHCLFINFYSLFPVIGMLNNNPISHHWLHTCMYNLSTIKYLGLGVKLCFFEKQISVEIKISRCNHPNVTIRFMRIASYSRILCGKSAESFRFWLFCIWWQTDKKKILKQSCKDLLVWTELPIVWSIVGSDNIFNIEVNGALAIHVHVIVHNQNKILDLRILRGYQVIDDIERWC